jgi:RHS repeat-associated protein
VATVFAQEAVPDTGTPSADTVTPVSTPVVQEDSTPAKDTTVDNTTDPIDLTTPPQNDDNTVDASSLKSNSKLLKSSLMANTLSSTLPPATNTTSPENPSSLATPGRAILAKPDQSTGALLYSYPITVPPGKNNLTPSLSIEYNSQKTDNSSIVGFGWELSIPYISKKNVHGVDQLYSRNDYISSEDGDLKLMQTNGTVLTFYPQSQDSNFSKYTLDTSTNTWRLVNKAGTVFIFGDSTSSRQDDSSNSAHVYKWMISSITDVNGNTISYTYTKDQNQIYPSNIHYEIFDISFTTESVSTSNENKSYGFTVVTAKRIKEIDTKINNQTAKAYVLNYTSDGLTSRSLISTITETGYSSSGNTTLPPTSFSYTNNNNTSNAWGSASNSFTLPDDSSIRVDNTGSSVFLDVNGDGLTDILTSWTDANGGDHRSAYLQNPNGTFSLSSAYQPPSDFPFGGYAYFLDLNGDGLVDMFYSGISINWETPVIYLNTGSGWTQGYSIPVGLTWAGSQLNTFADFNGDGLVDIYAQAFDNSNGYSHPAEIFLNNGDGTWTDAISTYGWSVPPVASNNTQARFIDVNGDGITDIENLGQVWIGDGKGGFVSNTSYPLSTPPLYACTTCSPSDPNQGITFFDVNHDGLTDLMQHIDVTSGSHNTTYLNTGTGWQQNTNFNIPINLSDGNYPTNNKIFDMNSDGVPDAFYYPAGGSYQSYLNNLSNKGDLLSTITVPTGGTSSITYKPSSQYKDSNNNLLNPNLPFIVQTANTITTTDPVNNIVSTDTYTYAGGSYYINPADPLDRKFAGFNKVADTDSAGNTASTYYHQGNTSDTSNGEYNDDEWKIGKPYRMEVTDSSGNLYSKTINKWEDYDLGNGSKFVKLVRTTNLNYYGSNHADNATEYTYDNSSGSILNQTEWGLVSASIDGTFTDTGSDKRSTDYEYATNTTNGVIALKHTTVSDINSTKVKESKYYYDTLSYGSIGNGNQTKEEKWVTGSTYVNTQKGYNSYGLVTSTTDPRGNSTTYSYDSYNLYPTTITDALSNVISYTYNYLIGNVVTKTDSNNKTWSVSYDGFGRTLQQNIPDPTGGSGQVTKTVYVYTDTSGAVSAKITNYLDGTNSVDSYQYFDGLGRLIQERMATEVSGTYNVKDYVYNNIGKIQEQSLPYSNTGASRTTASTVSSLYSIFTYDPLVRVLTSVNAVGTTSYTYAGLKTTITDPRGKAKSYYNDAYGNLIQVDENNSSSVYTTTYGRDIVGNLTSITDALSNVRNFTYDGLGNRLTAEDLHASGDGTYGSWSYTYDNAGNMTQSVSPNSKTTNYTYDVLNRQLTEDYTGATGTEITYAYDSCTNGIGKLCSITMTSGANTSYTYDSNGNIVSEAKTINSNVYTTSYTYDRQGNQLIITYPDSAQVRYTYNGSGLLNQVERKEGGGSFTNVISNIDYSPTGVPTTISYANGTTTTNTYDIANLYRLSNKRTTIFSEPVTYAPLKVKALVVGGGGGGANYGGGGGGGGVVYDATHSIVAGNYSITVGNGGNSGYNTAGGTGQNSVFDNITAYGGGGGGTNGGYGTNGASGGGGGANVTGTSYGSGISGQGYHGGNGSTSAGGGGGGGAGQTGQNALDAQYGAPYSAGNGGNGLSNSITGSAVYYGGGGGGGYYDSNNGRPGYGGQGGGGNGGANYTYNNGAPGVSNTGGGGGGTYGYMGSGGSGGSGIAVVSYHTDGSDGISSSSTGGTKTTSGSYTIHTFTSSGTLNLIPSYYTLSPNSNPVITLTGSSLINKIVGDTWTEPGYSASDTEDGNLTSSVIVTGSVNTAVAGTYQLVYSVVDSQGAPAARKIRTVVVSLTNNNPSMMVKTLVVGGGGGGGASRWYGGGGGGAGGYRENNSFIVTAKSYSITVGSGGSSGGYSGSSSNGQDSIFDTITAYGGGGGGDGGNSGSNARVGKDGGSGGGASGGYTPGNSLGGLGNQGGNGGNNNTNAGGGSGGGGAGGNGGSNSATPGIGISNSITGSSIVYAKGGSGNAAQDGLYGEGGNGSGSGADSNGNDGVVIIAYHTDGSDDLSPTSTGGTITTSGGYTIHTFTNSGTFTAVPFITPNNNPVITLTDSALIKRNIGDTWTDPGYSATDTEDGNLTSSVTVTGSVDTATAGTYQLVYAVVDSGGAPAARIIRTIIVAGAAKQLQNISYTYDPDGNITQVTDASDTSAAKTANYTYDDLNRLTGATITNVPTGQTTYSQTYTYNAIGNITNKSDVGDYLYTGTGYANPHAATSINGVTNTYDNDGNNLTDGTLTNTWNHKDQLTGTTNGTFTINYYYDQSGNRVRTKNGTNNTYYANKYYNVDPTGKKTKSIYANGELVGTVETVDAVVTPYYNHNDHLGSLNVVTDTNGAQVELLDYYPFGGQRISSGTYTGQKQYIGQYYDTDTGLNYLNARYYKATTGQFNSEDSMFWVLPQESLLDPQQQNSYSYSRNNPINRSDPSGNASILATIKSFFNSLFGNSNKNNQTQITANTSTQKNSPKTTTWDSVTNQRIGTLDSRVQQSATNFINNTESELGVKLRITEGYRTGAQQNLYYARSRTQEQLNAVGLNDVKARPDLPWNTNSIAGKSYHNYGRAIDVVIMENGVSNWNKPVTQEIANIGIKQGFAWGASFGDTPHFQMTLGQSINELSKTYGK